MAGGSSKSARSHLRQIPFLPRVGEEGEEEEAAFRAWARACLRVGRLARAAVEAAGADDALMGRLLTEAVREEEGGQGGKGMMGGVGCH